MIRILTPLLATVVLVGALAASVARARPVPDAGALTGHVVHAMTGRPAVGVTVLAEPVGPPAAEPGMGVAASFRGASTRANAAGQFTLESLPPGQYIVRTEHEHAFGAHGQTRPGAIPSVVSLGQDRAVHNLLVPLWPGSAISGALHDEQGRALPDRTVRMIPVAHEAAWTATRTDAAGRYHATHLWPGEYRVVVPVTWQDGYDTWTARRTDGGVTLLTTFAPDAREPESARLTTLGLREHRRGVDVRMQTAAAATLSGVIEAEPVAGTFFRLRLFRGRELERLDLADAELDLDEPGPFLVASLPRAFYTMEAERKAEGSDFMAYWPVRVPVDLRDGDAAVRVRFGEDRPLETTVAVDAAVARQVTTILGQVRDPLGPEDVVVVAFPVDRERWVESGIVPERLVVQPLNDDGTYAIVGLPPGEYFLRAIDEARIEEWPLPYVLRRLATGATRLALEAGEGRRVDLDVR